MLLSWSTTTLHGSREAPAGCRHHCASDSSEHRPLAHTLSANHHAVGTYLTYYSTKLCVVTFLVPCVFGLCHVSYALMGLQGTCEHHGPQAGSSSRLVAAAIARSSSEGQPLMALDCQPSLPRGAEELFCDSLRTQDLTGSSEALLRG